MNPVADALVLIVLIVLVVLAVRKLRRDRCAGKHACGGNCNACPMNPRGTLGDGVKGSKRAQKAASTGFYAKAHPFYGKCVLFCIFRRQ